MTGNIFKSADFSPATTQRLGLVKPDGTTVTIDANGTISSSVDLTNYVQKSSTEGLLKNNGTVDTNTYAQTSDLPGAATTSTLGLVKPDGTSVTVDNDGTIHSSGVSSDVVGSSEEQTTASKAYVVGDHFIRNNAFCTVVAAISQGDTLTENTNYIRGTIAELLSYLETSVTLSTSSTTPATFTSSRITTDSCIDVGVSEWGIVPDSVSVTTGECTVTMPKVDSAKTVTVRIYVK